mgnify:CR=1 FL=1
MIKECFSFYEQKFDVLDRIVTKRWYWLHWPAKIFMAISFYSGIAYVISMIVRGVISRKTSKNRFVSTTFTQNHHLVFSKLDDFNYVFDGKTALKDFYRVTKMEDDEAFEQQKGESETIAGFVLEIAGSFPKKGDIIVFNDYQFLVESLDKKRLKQIKVTLPHES